MSGYSRDFSTLKRELIARRELFVDPDFPANNRSILGHSVLPGELPDKKVEWKRPKEIVHLKDPDGQPRFVSGIFSRADLDQGKLGDCWFVAAAAVLVTGPRSQFERVVPPDQSFEPGDYAGIFRFRFWWYGEWIEVVVDDFLPTNGKRLIYCRNRQEPDEFWCALLEKAYAKLHGSYNDISSGNIATALVDMTGGIGEIIRIVEKYKVPRDFFNSLMKNLQMNSLLTAGINRRSGGRLPNGLYQNHGYSITGIIKIPFEGRTVELMRIRNPHGRREWNGAWSDESPEMKRLSSDIKSRYGMEVRDDGEFWMQYEDFIKNFDQVEMSHLEPDLIGTNLAADAGKRNWNMTVYHGEWIRGISAGGCGNAPHAEMKWMNPQYHVQLKDPDVTDNEFKCTIIISLMEKQTDKSKRIAIGYDIYRVRDPLNGPIDENERLERREVIWETKFGSYQQYREAVKRFSLSPGHYIILPCTYKPHKEANFLLRIFTEQPALSGYSRDFNALKRELIARRELFVDPDFPPNSRSILGHSVLPGELPDKKVEWKRPKEIVQLSGDSAAQPRFVSGSFSRADLDQGKLGNCWFVAAASVLVTGPRAQFERVVPPDQSFEPGEYAGIFRFNFWWYGQWTEVIVDDFLPTNGTKLIYCQSRQEPDEFWSALLEKAYAKLHGSYEDLVLGKIATALVDLTGGVSEIIRITEKYKVPKNLFNDLVKNMQMNSLLTGSIKKRSGGRLQNGLYQGHGYSITGLIQIPHEGSVVKLMRIRNPHGEREWNGAWSDESREMRSLPSDVKAEHKMEAIDDGEFWMSYEDFIKNFDQVQMSHIEPDMVGMNLAADAGKNNWHMTQYHGEWKRGISAGGSGNTYDDLFWINPQYHVHLKDPDVTDNEYRCTLVVSLMEKQTDKNKKIAIGFGIYKVRNPPDEPINEKLTERELIFKEKYGKYQHYREITKRFSLFPGHYVVIPSTFKPHKEAKFLLRIFTEKSAVSGMIYRRGRH